MSIRAKVAAMAGWIATALYLLDLTMKVVALGVVPKNRRPSSGMAWLLVILMIPFLGIVIFLVLGRTRLGRRRDEQQAEVNAIVAERTAAGAHARGRLPRARRTSRRWPP